MSMYYYDPYRTCKYCEATDTSFFGFFKNKQFTIHNVCYLCKREQRNLNYFRRYHDNMDYKQYILTKNKKWNNTEKAKKWRKNYDNEKIVESLKENFYLTERV